LGQFSDEDWEGGIGVAGSSDGEARHEALPPDEDDHA
jgi:hypothetical protein